MLILCYMAVRGVRCGFPGSQLNDLETTAVVADERHALGKPVGDAAQPGDIAAASKYAILTLERGLLINNAKQPLPDLSSSYRGACVVGIHRPAFRVKLPGRDNRSEYANVTNPPGNLKMRYRSVLEPDRKKEEFSRSVCPSSGWLQIQYRGTGTNE